MKKIILFSFIIYAIWACSKSESDTFCVRVKEMDITYIDGKNKDTTISNFHELGYVTKEEINMLLSRAPETLTQENPVVIHKFISFEKIDCQN